MGFAELRAFDAVARHMSFVRAAEELGRTQPTLTMQVAQLERSYGVELLVRSRGKISSLTPLGRQLHDTTRTLLTLERDAYNLLRDAGNLSGGEVRICATAPVMAVRLTKAFTGRHPDIDCHMQFGNSEEVLRSILECSADIGILGGNAEHPDCVTIPIAKPEIVLVGHKNHPAAASGSITREAFSRETLLIREPGSETRELVVDKMRQFGFEPGRFVEIGRRSGAVAAAAAGMGLAAVSEHEIEASDDLRIVRFENFRVFGVNHAICLKSRSGTVLLKALLACCENLGRPSQRAERDDE